MTRLQHGSPARLPVARRTTGVLRDKDGHVVVEYVPKRAVLRLRALKGGDGARIEVPLDSFIAQLGLDVWVGKGARTYLLVSAPGLHGPHRPGEFVQAFDSEAQAKEAFRLVRLAPGSRGGWAELLALDDGGLTALCWFGLPPAAIDTTVATRAESEPATGRGRGRSLRRAIGRSGDGAMNKPQRRARQSRMGNPT